MSLEERTDELKQCEDSKLSLNVSRDDYESLPKIMKGLASWEVQRSSFVSIIKLINIALFILLAFITYKNLVFLLRQ